MLAAPGMQTTHPYCRAKQAGLASLAAAGSSKQGSNTTWAMHSAVPSMCPSVCIFSYIAARIAHRWRAWSKTTPCHQIAPIQTQCAPKPAMPHGYSSYQVTQYAPCQAHVAAWVSCTLPRESWLGLGACQRPSPRK